VGRNGGGQWVKYNVHNAAEPTNRTRKALQLLMLGYSGRAVGRALGMSKSNVYRWAIEEGKKILRHLDKPSD